MSQIKPIRFNKKQQTAFTTKAHEILYGGARAGGKLIYTETPILTTNGWKTMDTVEIGDQVFDENGVPCNVISKSDINIDEKTYKLIFDDSSEIIAGERHQWWTINRLERRRNSRRNDEYRLKRKKKRKKRSVGKRPDLAEQNSLRKYKYKNNIDSGIRTTKEIFESLIDNNEANHSIPLCKPLHFEKKDLIVPPYVLGSWLADGATKSGNYTGVDSFIWEKIETYGYKVTHSKKEKKAHYINGLVLQLKKIGVYANKHIPLIYKNSSIEQRIELIQGIMDGDGSVNKSSGYELSISDEILSQDIYEVLLSLGIKCNRKKNKSYLYGIEKKDRYRFKFKSNIQLVTLPRKAERLIKKPALNTTYRLIKNVVEVENLPKVCIQVDSPNNIYLVGKNLIPTHNSFLIRYASILYSLAIPGLQTYLFRRNVKDLKKNHLAGHESFLVVLHPFVKKEKCKINQTDLRIDFDNGSQIHLCHCQHDKDVEKYRGAEIHFLLIDESTQFTPFQIDFLRTNVRVGGFKIDYKEAQKTMPFLTEDFFPRIMYATNPGGISHCIPYGDVLTDNGWKKIEDVAVNELVLTIDKNYKIEKKKVLNTFKYSINEDLVHIKNRKLDIVCTENHGIAYLPDPKNYSTFTIKPFDELPNQCNVLRAGKKIECQNKIDTFTVSNSYSVKKQKLNQPLKIKHSDYAELMGWVLTEGCFNLQYNFFDIAQSKKHNILKIKTLLKRIGFTYSFNKHYFRIYSAEWAKYFSQFGKCEDKFIPRELLDSTDINKLFKSMMAGDGTWVTKSGGSYTTYSEKLRDDFMEVCVKLGYIVSYKVVQNKNRRLPNQVVAFHKTKTNATEFYTGNKIYKNRKKINLHRPNWNYIPFEGNVYCIEVEDNHNFICRQNNKVWISGNSYFKSGWMKPANPPMSIFKAPQDEGGMDRIYIPAQITDNEQLMENDPTYRDKLMGLGEDNEVRAMLYGDWDALGGDAFGDLWDPKLHIIKPFPIPKSWYIDRTFDWGSSHPFGTIWWAESDGSTVSYEDPDTGELITKTYPDGTIFAFAEDYGCVDGKANRGLKLTAREVGARIREKELDIEEKYDMRDRINPGAADGRIFDTQYGYEKKQSIHDNLVMGYESVPSKEYPNGKPIYELFSREVVQYSGSRIKSFELMRTYLKASTVWPPEDPGIYIFDTCKHWINTVPMLSRDPDKVEDVDTKSEDHLYDVTRYRLFTKKKIFSDIEVSGI